jgi:hypothetical protein
MGIPKAAFKLLKGKLGEFTVKSNGGRDVTRQFCVICGSPLFTEAEMVPDLIFVKAGSLDDPSWVKPTVNCWTSRAHPWSPIVTELQSFSENPVL